MTANLPATFGVWVRTRRKQLDLTQSELGERAGCSEAAVRKIEADERKPSRQLAELLARALEIPASEKDSFLQFARGVLMDGLRIETKSHPGNLPTLLTSTVNRTRDLANVSTLLKDKTVHLVTLIGPPGIGKTRLSVHCGNELLDDFPDGVWFVDLAGVQNPDFFLPTLARSLPGLNLPPSPSLDQLLRGLKDERLLLILDNFEHIVEKSALDVAQILKACPHLKILATSRVPLHVYGEQEYALLPLSIPPRDIKKTETALLQFESVQLFIARTRQHQPKFNVTSENADAVIDICTILDGIPLALELAAATLRQVTLDEMVTMLRRQGWVKQLATSARDLPERQRTLENVIDWSYTLLYDRQKESFCKLGVFSGWFDAEAAAAVCEAESPIFLNALTDHSMLEREIFKGRFHWRMLELIHEFAVSRLTKAGHSRVEHLRAQYFLNKLTELKQGAPRETQEEYFQINSSNFHGALKWAIAEQRIELGLQLVSVLEGVWSSLGYFKEGLDLLGQILALPSRIDPSLRANYLQTASDLAWQQHDFETALAYSKEAAELGRKYDLKGKYPAYINRLGRIYIEQGKYDEAKQPLLEVLELARREPENMNPGVPLAQLGEIAFFEGRLEEASSFLKGALPHLTDYEMIFLAMARTDLAEIALAEGDLETARDWLVKAYPAASQHTRRFLVFLCALAGYLVLSGKKKENIQKAAQLYGAVETLSAKSGIQFNSFYQHLNQERMKQALGKLSAGEWQKAYKTGLGWERSEAVRQVKSVLGM